MVNEKTEQLIKLFGDYRLMVSTCNDGLIKNIEHVKSEIVGMVGWDGFKKGKLTCEFICESEAVTGSLNGLIDGYKDFETALMGRVSSEMGCDSNLVDRFVYFESLVEKPSYHKAKEIEDSIIGMVGPESFRKARVAYAHIKSYKTLVEALKEAIEGQESLREMLKNELE